MQEYTQMWNNLKALEAIYISKSNVLLILASKNKYNSHQVILREIKISSNQGWLRLILCFVLAFFLATQVAWGISVPNQGLNLHHVVKVQTS